MGPESVGRHVANVCGSKTIHVLLSSQWQPVCNCVCDCRYGVPGSGARRFEEVMRMTAPQRFEQDRDLLHHLTTLTPPPLLMHNGACR